MRLYRGYELVSIVNGLPTLPRIVGVWSHCRYKARNYSIPGNILARIPGNEERQPVVHSIRGRDRDRDRLGLGLVIGIWID